MRHGLVHGSMHAHFRSEVEQIVAQSDDCFWPVGIIIECNETKRVLVLTMLGVFHVARLILESSALRKGPLRTGLSVAA